MVNEIFRQKSLKKIQSPDNLNEYIKVISPGLWVVFIAAFILLAGAFVWGSVGKIEDKVIITAVVKNDVVSCEYNESFEKGMKAFINGYEGSVDSVSASGTKLSFEKNIQDGVYSGYVVTNVISPISFVFN